MIELVPELLEAQDSMERNPLVSLLATQINDSIPFDGTQFSTVDATEKYPDVVTSEDGHIIGAYIEWRYIVIVSTDLAQIEWTARKFYYWPGYWWGHYGLAIVEMSPGVIGAMTIFRTSIQVQILDETSTPNGVDRAGYIAYPRNVATFSAPEYVTCLNVIKLQDGTYFAAYIVLNTTADTYTVYSITSSDFLTWSAPSVVPLTGLIAGRPVDNVSILQVLSGDIMIFFDYASVESDDGALTVTNIYNVLSADGGGTWSVPDAITSYTKYGSSGVNPDVALRTDGSIALAFTDKTSVLFANKNTLLWDNIHCGTWSSTQASNIHFDPVRRRCYVSQMYTYVGIKAFCGVVVIDVDLWEVVGTYNAHTVPGYSEIFENVHVWTAKDDGEGEFVVVSMEYIVLCIDDLKRTVTQYNFKSNTAYELSKNVDISMTGGVSLNNINITSTFMDAEARKCYVLLASGGGFQIGYFDVDEPADPNNGYKFNTISSASDVLTGYVNPRMFLVRELNMIVLEGYSALPCRTAYAGYMLLIDMTSGGIIKDFRRTTHNNFPISGTSNGTYYDGSIYTSFHYCDYDDQEEFKGLCQIDINTEQITYHQPTYVTANQYTLSQKVATVDGRILIGGGTHGAVTFNTVDGVWTKYDKYTVPGFEPGSGTSWCGCVAYDEENGNILVGSSNNGYGSFTGLRMFNESGSFNQGVLVPGVLTEQWDWGPKEELTVSKVANDISITVDHSNVLWTLWIDGEDNAGTAIWDKDVKEMLLEDYILAGTSVTVKKGLDNTGTLTFSLSNGHLFDQNNLLSTFNDFIRKGKLIEIAFGEQVGEFQYWQNQGHFIINSTKLTYSRGTHPVMNVSCVSADYLWNNIKVVASQRYEGTAAEDVALDILLKHTNRTADDVVINTFPNSHAVHHQWVDTDLKSLMTELLGHFQSLVTFDVDGNLVTRTIETGRAVDHYYTGTEVMQFSPDDEYSSFTNRITINGEGQYFIQVTYGEELMETITGTCGWWEGGHRTITVNYSTDREKVCYDPRMVIERGMKDYNSLWPSEGDESLSYVDPENRYCIITVELPDQIEYLVSLLGMTLTFAWLASTCGGYTGPPCGPFILAITLFQLAASWCIAQMCSYEYEIYAKPTGSVKQTVTHTVNDLDFLRELGGVVTTEEYDDPFCYTVQSCQEVAEYEMGIVRGQRKRVNFVKLAHLQDEILDKIRIAHPYSNFLMDVLITDLERTYTKPDKSTNTGGFTDKITGWKL